MTTTEEFLTVEQLAARLGWTAKTVQNKMSGKEAVFQRGVHYDSPRGLPTLFRWSAVLALYQFKEPSIAEGTRTDLTTPPVFRAAAGARRPGEKRSGEIGA